MRPHLAFSRLSERIGAQREPLTVSVRAQHVTALLVGENEEQIRFLRGLSGQERGADGGERR
ncbi:MAG: hypothetical protein AAGA96_11225 [Verrucomicrobiota bacterium]